jgi:small subunit ribosomal protein S21
MTQIVVWTDIDKAIRQFTKRCMQAGIFRELKDKTFYRKPSERKKLKRIRSENRRRKALIKKFGEDRGR